MNNKKLAKNLILSVAAQAISLLTSFIVGLVVPKFIDGLQYSYWEIFLLYFSYVGVFHFGLLDGLILKYSQYDYEQLDKARLRSQFQALLLITGTASVLTALISAIALGDEYVLIGVLVAVGIVVQNTFTYNSYTFQMTNRIKYYALLVIAQRLLYGLLIVLCLLCKLTDFYWFCLADLVSLAVASIVSAFFNKGMYFGKSLALKEAFSESWSNIAAGAFLMIANLSSMLIVGGAKMVIQWRWDELIFGKLAFAFRIANLFLSFVSAISVVLFPSLKRMKEEEYPALFETIRGMLMPVLFFVLLFYFPGCWILNIWLPKYSESLTYLGILLPLIVFASKNNLLTNNYLKAYRKERLMLALNLGSVALGMLLFLIGAYGFNHLESILFSLIATIMVSSIVSEIIVRNKIQKLNYKHFIIEALMVAAFIFAARYCKLWIGLGVYAIALIVYLIIYSKSIVKLIRSALQKTTKN